MLDKYKIALVSNAAFFLVVLLLISRSWDHDWWSVFIPLVFALFGNTLIALAGTALIAKRAPWLDGFIGAAAILFLLAAAMLLQAFATHKGDWKIGG